MAGPLPVRPATDSKRVGRQRTSVLSWVIGRVRKDHRRNCRHFQPAACMGNRGCRIADMTEYDLALDGNYEGGRSHAVPSSLLRQSSTRRLSCRHTEYLRQPSPAARQPRQGFSRSTQSAYQSRCRVQSARCDRPVPTDWPEPRYPVPARDNNIGATGLLHEANLSGTWQRR